jgi:ribosomal protein S18 acetylase RimI-like enzyme
MKFEQKIVKLKDGTVVTIRICVESDAENLIHTIKTYLGDSDFIPRNPDEYKLTFGEQKALIRSFLEEENSLLLVAVKGEQILGNIDLTGNLRETMRHTAVIGMGILKEWRNSGLGTELMKLSINWAKTNPILELLCLQVYAENELGVALYKKSGFEENGRIEHFFKQNGRYYDNVMMHLKVK